ncbi:MAG: hypothetical protein CBB71_02755 [Rhodopirellula sp. TMED11]|nr:MAG: hypothetical protein CBB71_02755 [Rhodopirellula sp. TMED11]
MFHLIYGRNNPPPSQSKFPGDQSQLFEFQELMNDPTPINELDLDSKMGYVEIAKLAAKDDKQATAILQKHISEVMKQEQISYAQFKTVTSGLVNLGRRYQVYPEFRDKQTLKFIESHIDLGDKLPPVEGYGNRFDDPNEELSHASICGLHAAGQDIERYAGTHADMVQTLQNAPKHQHHQNIKQTSSPFQKKDESGSFIEQGSSIDLNQPASKKGFKFDATQRTKARNDLFDGLNAVKQFSND